MQVIIATTNPGKYRELVQGLQPLGWEMKPLIDFLVELPEESGTTFEDNALMKAAFVAQKTGLAALGDDSGLVVDALGGEPGIYSARYGGRTSDRDRNVYLLERLRGVPPEERTARFVAVLTLAYPDGHVESYRGEVEGRIPEAPRGEGGFGYDPLFYLPELDKTFAEMEPEEKAQHSHRARALQALLEAWKDGPPPREIWALE
jgi:XTP/dITP diphosphohydrolase